MGCNAKSFAMKALQPQYLGKSPIVRNKSMLKHLSSLAMY